MGVGSPQLRAGTSHFYWRSFKFGPQRVLGDALLFVGKIRNLAPPVKDAALGAFQLCFRFAELSLSPGEFLRLCRHSSLPALGNYHFLRRNTLTYPIAFVRYHT